MEGWGLEGRGMDLMDGKGEDRTGTEGTGKVGI